ncbi:MAG: hypothetical protein ACOC2G_01695 [Bacillota bacterium]
MLKQTKDVWGKCPKCDSNKVQPVSFIPLLIGLFVVFAFIYMWNMTVGFFLSIIPVIIVIFIGILKISNRELMKCQDCNKFYIKNLNKRE